jgi:hypothetical protein
MKDIQEFVDEINKTDYLIIKAVEQSEDLKDDSLIIENTSLGCDFKVLVDAIYHYDWMNLKRVLDGGDPMILDHMTRIVGYFSKTKNWNQSKLGELADRRKGDYQVGT